MLMQDLIYAWRTLRKRTAFTTVAVVVLALGIGANTAMFSVVNSVLLRPLPFKDPGRLVMVYSHNLRREIAYSTLSADDLADFQRQNDVFQGLAAVTPQWAFSVTFDHDAEQVFGAWVGANFFEVLGAQPLLGRPFTASEDRTDGTPAVILSYELWQQRFGSDPNILNKTLAINGQPASIVGVMPRGFRFIEDSALWVPAGQNPISSRGRNVRYLNAIGRLKDGVSMTRAASTMATVAGRLESEYPATNTGFTTDLRPLLDHITGQARPALLVLLGAVAFVLLIACANVANLLLARSVDRQREVAIRNALGADRRRLIKQLLTESVLLSVIGAMGGLLIAYWIIPILISLGPNIPRLDEISIDVPVFIYTFGLSILTGIVFGLLPALQITQVDLRTSSAQPSRNRLRQVLAVSEIALAFILLVSSGLLIRSFMRLINVNPGYRTGDLIIANTLVPMPKYSQEQSRLSLYYAIEDKLKTVPGVISVGAVNRFPLSSATGSNNVTNFFTIEGQTVTTGERPEIDYRVASTGYFETMGIPLIAGRRFTRQDSSEVVIINDVAARRFWPNQDPIGKRINFTADLQQNAWVTIIGIVGNVRHVGLDVAPRPEVYRPYAYNPMNSPTIVLNTATDPSGMLALVTHEIHSVEREMPVRLDTITRLVDLSLAQRRFSMLVLAVFAATAMILATVGIYGVISYSVSQRSQEIGLRMALGAESRQVLRKVVAEGAGIALVGVAIGIAGSIAVSRALSGLLFGIAGTDLVTYVTISFLLIGIALIACYLPARRASRVDPLTALRHE
jgi:putative ABC transport system permease protein